jgi:hypothetical protein
MVWFARSQRAVDGVRRWVPMSAGVAFAALLAVAPAPGSVAAAKDGAHEKPEPRIPEGVERVPHDADVFKPDPGYESDPYNPGAQVEIYGGKSEVDEPRPVFELQRPLYVEGPFEPGSEITGSKNLFIPNLRVFGDWRNEVVYADNGATEIGQVATRLNVDVDLGLTATERLHAFFQPLDKNGKFSRCEFSGGDSSDDCELELDGNAETLFFEGDMGRIAESLTGEYNNYDVPFAVGKVPFVAQNGLWMEDAIIGGAVAIPALNSPALDISNMDITFFAGFDDVDNPGIVDANGAVDDNDLNVYGAMAFIDATQGYWEAGIAYLDGEGEIEDQSNVSATIAFTRRYGGWLSNSVRVFGNFGQDRDNGLDETADGFALLVENSLITAKPLTLVPYFNAWVGIDRPQPLVSDQGLLQNTGIAFQADALTAFPELDDTAADTFGGALGIEYLFDLDQQIVGEVATVQTHQGDRVPGQPAQGEQYALALRYQLPLARDWIFRADAIHGWRENADDITGVRTEIRWKF